jgi:PAS domain S-box-containing protein
MSNWFSRFFTIKIVNDKHEDEMMAKVRHSQLTLLAAATSTADAAHDVTTLLKRRLDDGIRQIEVTSKLLHDALIICTPDGLIISFNRAAEIIFGWEASQIIGQSISSLFTHETGSHLAVEDVLFILSAQSPIDGSEQYNEHIEQIRGKQKNGNLIWVDGNVSQFERQDGSILMLLLIKDVSKIMAVQQLLLENESRYRGIFEQSFDGIMVVDNHHVVAVNPAMTCILGYLEEEMIAQPITNFITDEFQQIVSDSHQRRLQGDSKPHNYLIQVIKADDSCVDVLVSSTMIIWDGRRSSLLTLKDLTKIKS